MIKGIPVTLYEKRETGRDGFNRAVFEEFPTVIANCLVAPVEASDNSITGTLDLNGKHGLYQIAIPKGDAHAWEDCAVEFFGKRWKVIGFSAGGIEENIPLSWNRKVVVERYG